MLELMVVLNIVMVLLMVSFWVGFIFWKGSVKKFMNQLEEAFKVYYNNIHFNGESSTYVPVKKDATVSKGTSNEQPS